MCKISGGHSPAGSSFSVHLDTWQTVVVCGRCDKSWTGKQAWADAYADASTTYLRKLMLAPVWGPRLTVELENRNLIPVHQGTDHEHWMRDSDDCPQCCH